MSKFFPDNKDPFEVANERKQNVKDLAKFAEDMGKEELSEFLGEVAKEMDGFNWMVLPLSADFVYSLLLIKKPWVPLRTYPKDKNVIMPGGKKTRDGRWIRDPIPNMSFRIPEVGPIGLILGLAGSFIRALNLRFGYEDPKKFKVNGVQSFLAVYCSGYAICVGRCLHTNKEIRDKYYDNDQKKLYDCYEKLKPFIGKWLALQIAELKHGGFGFEDA